MSEPRYVARCASDRDPTWQNWFVADCAKGGVNATIPVIELVTGQHVVGIPVASRVECEWMAEAANALEAGQR